MWFDFSAVLSSDAVLSNLRIPHIRVYELLYNTLILRAQLTAVNLILPEPPGCAAVRNSWLDIPLESDR